MRETSAENHQSKIANRRWLLAVLVGLFLLAGITYDLATPIFEKPDESFHFFFAVQIARGEGLPDQRNVGENDLWQQEGSQPPLYHILAGTLLRAVPLDNAEAHAVRNPHHAMGMPKIPGNNNIFVHAPDAGPFATPTHTAVHLARWLSLLMGAITVWATWHLAHELLPAQPLVAWATAGVVAFTPQFLFISSAVSNDATVAAVVTVALWLLVRAIRRGLTPAETALFAVAVGAAALTKLNGLIFLAIAVGMLVLVFWRDRGNARRAGTVHPLAIAAGLVVAVTAIAGWWYVRNWHLYGDPTGLSAMLDIIGRRDDPLSFSYLKWELSGLDISYWGLFGWFNVLVDDWFYVLMDAVVGIAALGLIWRLVRWLRSADRTVSLEWLPVIAWPILVLAGLIRWTMLTPGIQGRLLYPAIAPIALLIVLGWLALISRRWQPAFVAVAGTAWALWALVLPWRIIAPAYAAPPHGQQVAMPAEATPVNYQYGPVRLLGYTVEPERVQRSEPFHLTLYWQPTEQIEQNYSVGVKVFGRDQQLIAREDTYPGLGTYPTKFWQPGETIVDRYKIWISGQADLPVLGDIWVDLYRREGIQALPAMTPDGEQVSVPRIGRLKVAPPPKLGMPPPDVEFVDGIGLDEITIAPERVQAGDSITTTLVWQTYADPSVEYNVFVHLVPAGEVTEPLAQADGVPRDGAYPTSVWAAGERITDTHTLRVPEDLSAGDYDVLAGLYRPDTSQRLLVADGTDHVRLARLSSDGNAWRVEALPLTAVAKQEDS